MKQISWPLSNVEKWRGIPKWIKKVCKGVFVSSTEHKRGLRILRPAFILLYPSPSANVTFFFKIISKIWNQFCINHIKGINYAEFQIPLSLPFFSAKIIRCFPFRTALAEGQFYCTTKKKRILTFSLGPRWIINKVTYSGNLRILKK